MISCVPEETYQSFVNVMTLRVPSISAEVLVAPGGTDAGGVYYFQFVNQDLIPEDLGWVRGEEVYSASGTGNEIVK